MAAIFRWHGDSVLRDITRGQKRNVARAGAYLSADIKSKFQRTPMLMGKRGARRRGGPGHRLYEPSRPGEIPAVQKGHLRRSIISETDVDVQGPVSRVGPMSTVKGMEMKYARYLEFGTRKMRARPYMRPALARNRLAIGRLLAGG